MSSSSRDGTALEGRRLCFRGSAGPIRSLDKLAAALRTNPAYLREVAARSDEINYKPVAAPAKRNGQAREVFSPSRDIRTIQRRLVEVFFKDPRVINWPPFIFGGIHRDALSPLDSRDHVACARVHCGSKSLLKLDVEDFFGNVNFDIVKQIFTELLGWTEEPATLATKLCTRDGRLPQGGITSSYLALLCLHDVEPKLFRTLQYKKLAYTRYVDDITISSKASNQDFTQIAKLVEGTLASKGLFLNSTKIAHQIVGLEAICVHGLNVAFNVPILPGREVRRIKGVCRQTVAEANEVGRRSHLYRRRYFRAMGLVNKLARVKSSHHARLVTSLRQVCPLPSFSDYQIATDVAHSLRESFDKKKKTFWYWRRYNVLMARLDLIGVENKSWAKTLRKYMRSHFRPEYKVNQ